MGVKELVKACVEKSRPVLLYGEPGSGKSHMAREIAKQLKMATKEINAHEYMTLGDMIGFNSAIDGRWVDTGLQELYAKGGLLIVDEFDNLPTATMVGFNSVLDSKELEFNNVLVKRHNKFTVIVTGNTAGKGATSEFPSRNPIDRSTLNRFVSFYVTYDEAEEAKVYGNPLAKFGKEARKYSKENSMGILITMRTYQALSDLAGMVDKLVIKGTVTKGLMEETTETKAVDKLYDLYCNIVAKPAPEPVEEVPAMDTDGLDWKTAVIMMIGTDEIKSQHTVWGGKKNRAEITAVLYDRVKATLPKNPVPDSKIMAKIDAMLYQAGFRNPSEGSKPAMGGK